MVVVQYGSVNAIVGQRKSGKTTLIKEIIKNMAFDSVIYCVGNYKEFTNDQEQYMDPTNDSVYEHLWYLIKNNKNQHRAIVLDSQFMIFDEYNLYLHKLLTKNEHTHHVTVFIEYKNFLNIVTPYSVTDNIFLLYHNTMIRHKLYNFILEDFFELNYYEALTSQLKMYKNVIHFDLVLYEAHLEDLTTQEENFLDMKQQIEFWRNKVAESKPKPTFIETKNLPQYMDKLRNVFDDLKPLFGSSLTQELETHFKKAEDTVDTLLKPCNSNLRGYYHQIIGPRKSGKTTFVKKFIKDFNPKHVLVIGSDEYKEFQTHTTYLELLCELQKKGDTGDHVMVIIEDQYPTMTNTQLKLIDNQCRRFHATLISVHQKRPDKIECDYVYMYDSENKNGFSRL